MEPRLGVQSEVSGREWGWWNAINAAKNANVGGCWSSSVTMDCLIEYVHDVQVDSDVKTVPCACADLELFLITMACVFHAARIAQQGRPVQRRKTNAHACSPTKIPGNAQENALKAR